MAKTKRNDPCPCGSGKKYKHCCSDKEVQLLRAANPWGRDTEWLKIRRTEGEVVMGILEFVAGEWPGLLEVGAEVFRGEYDLDDDHLESIFIPWVVFNWIPGLIERGPSRRPFPEQQLGLEYLEEKAALLDDYQQAFILMACAQPFSFFAVTDVVAGKSLGLRDIFLDRRLTVKEAQASKTLRCGDIIFARVVPLQGQAIAVGMGPLAIPPSQHTRLLDIRDEIKTEMREEGFELNLESLHEWGLEMREVYLSAADLLANPPRPELQNTDGDPISFVTLYFELGCSPQEAFDGLRSLALAFNHDRLLDDAVRDTHGNLLEVRFDWAKKGNKKHKSWDNTVLGTLEIKGTSLTAEVNSEKRAKKLQSEIKKRLGAWASFKQALHESLDAKIEELEGQSDSPALEEARREQEEFASSPEVRAIVKAQLEAHWEGWYNERVPALKNKTPLQAARTKAGRERLEALLVDFERKNEEALDPLLRVDLDAMRKRLGLTHR